MSITVVPTKSDNDFMFYLQSYKELIIDRSLLCINPILSIDHLCINPILWIGLIHKSDLSIISRFTLAQVKCTG